MLMHIQYVVLHMLLLLCMLLCWQQCYPAWCLQWHAEESHCAVWLDRMKCPPRFSQAARFHAAHVV